MSKIIVPMKLVDQAGVSWLRESDIITSISALQSQLKEAESKLKIAVEALEEVIEVHCCLSHGEDCQCCLLESEVNTIATEALGKLSKDG